MDRLNIFAFLKRADILALLLLWLMVLLFLGTVAQKDIGLYMAQKTYFSTFIFWIHDLIPLPGGYSVMIYIFISLLVKTFSDEWHFSKLGTLVTHIGALLLLLGGFITAIWSEEGYMLIPEGKSLNYVSDYYAVEIVVMDDDSGEELAIFDEQTLSKGGGTLLQNSTIPFTMKLDVYCRNCAVNRTEKEGVTVKPRPLEKNYEQNIAGAIVHISGLDEEQNGQYAMVDFIPPVRTFEKEGKNYKIQIRDKRTYLPFSIHLIDFEKKNHPGTQLAKSYKSEVEVKSKEGSWHSLIQMNEPLRFEGYTFYQSSFTEGVEQATVLAVVKNYGWMFPYISSIVMCFGLLVHLFMRLPTLLTKGKDKEESKRTGRKKASSRKSAVLAFLLVLFSASDSYAQAESQPVVPTTTMLSQPKHHHSELQEREVLSLGQLPILVGGRLKPLDTFARYELLSLYGRDKLPQMTASQWLEEVLFNQKDAYLRPLFNIANPQIVDALYLKWDTKHRYSFVDVFLGLQKNREILKKVAEKSQQELSLVENQLLEINQKALRFYALSRTFSLLQDEFVVLNALNAKNLGVEQGEAFDYLKMLTLKDKFIERVEALENKPKKEVSADERELMELGYTLRRVGEDISSDVLTIIPPTVEGVSGQGAWSSPWQILKQGAGTPKTAEILTLWKEAGQAYLQENVENYRKVLAGIDLEMRQLTAVNTFKLQTEIFYNTYNPFKISLVFYVLSFILLIGSLLGATLRSPFVKGATFLSLLGLAVHGCGVMLRMYIMSRPPVATLYESILFVGFICVCLSFVLYHKKSHLQYLVMVVSLGAILQFIGLRYASEGDTMGMLSAVLNTNFWLSTHVVCITIGYGVALVAGFLAHVHLLKTLMKADRQDLRSLMGSLQACVLIALFFVTLGTILGGVWADQSWGRFWGWDPKENGAMFLSLWMIFLVHGKLSGLLKTLSYTAFAALTPVVVALAWFGVNLLGVGLHSYGFTENIAENLLLFCLGEVLFVSIFTLFIVMERRQ